MIHQRVGNQQFQVILAGADMPRVFTQAHIVCLPSYREGLPKVLIEAAASVRPIVTTDVPGCREIVRHGENGLLRNVTR